MHSNLEEFLQAAEDHYLHPKEMDRFKQQVDELQDRLALYEVLRDQELAIFQVVTHQLEKESFSTSQADLEKVLTHWISVLRCSAMAMLMQQPNYLQSHLSWLVDILDRKDFSAVNNKVSELIHQCLSSSLSEEQLSLIEPFIKQADDQLVSEDRNHAFAVLS